ncbi:hypothetical protein FQN57_002912 [Myotisia sp. PD_48]|nr:hypothetical protein FQN57_002912 [Myotisia sp. PD_48]
MQFFSKNKSQPALVNPIESAQHNNRDQANSNSTASYIQPLPPQGEDSLNQQRPLGPHSASPQPSSNADTSHNVSLQYQGHSHPQPGQHQQESNISYTHPAHTVIRSESLRHPLQSSPRPFSVHFPPGRPTLSLVPSGPSTGEPDQHSGSFSAHPGAVSSILPHRGAQASPPPPETQQRKSRLSFFGLHSRDKDKDKDKEKQKEKEKEKHNSSAHGSSRLSRNISVRRKVAAQPTPVENSNIDSAPPFDPPLELDEGSVSDPHMPLSKNKPSQAGQSQSVYPSRGDSRSSSHLGSQSFEPPQVQRVHTDPSGLEYTPPQGRQPQYDQYPEGFHETGQHHPQFQIDQPQIHSSHQASDQVSIPPGYSPKLDSYNPPRPPSQQSFGPPSPLNPSYQSLDSNFPKNHFRQSLQPVTGSASSQGVMASEKPTGLRQPGDPTQPPPQLHPQQSQQHHGPNQHQLVQGQPQFSQPPPGMPQGHSLKVNPQSSGTDRDQEIPPQPGKAKDDQPDIDARALLQKHEELQVKYNRVKKYYFEKDAQVTQLQNTVAHQRMSNSRTVLDDNEYATRFNRLDGAINNLSFNIRKDWKNIPPWLQGVVNGDAHTAGTKVMTAVGRGCLTRWIVDEIFDRYFHPGLEPNLSRQLKQIEKNVRRNDKGGSEEDRDNHLARLSTWRRTTLDGLSDVLQSKLADDHRIHLTKNLVEKLTASLEMNLKSPPPPGLENGVAMIIELAVGIISNIPLESRDVTVEYFLPGTPVSDSHMKLENTFPPLTNANSDARLISEPTSAATDRADQGSMKGLDTGDGSVTLDDKDTSSQAPKDRKKSVFGSLISKKPHPGPAERPPSANYRDYKERDELETVQKIRFSAFVSVEVRAKGAGNVIVKAPVYAFA